MARFAPLTAQTDDSWLRTNANEQYEHGFSFSTEDYDVISKPGLNDKIIELIAHSKNEPEWMRQLRRQAYLQFLSKPTPLWGADLSAIDYDAIHYYLRPSANNLTNWQDVPDDIKQTFERIGVPQAEREYLAGVKMQYDSEVVYGSLRQTWEKDGVIFLSMDEGLARYPDLVKQYFGTVIPSGDNKFAALNTAVWSGGSFVYIPPGVKVSMPLQTYFRINSPNAGQFERTLIIVDEGAEVHYVEGCFTAGTLIQTEKGWEKIENIKKDQKVLTHTGSWQPVTHTQVRPYSGKLFSLKIRGIVEKISTTEEHPFFVVKRQQENNRNKKWNPQWVPAKDLKKNDYLCMPIDQTEQNEGFISLTVSQGNGKGEFKDVSVKFPINEEFFRLAGYYLAEGSISSGHYLNFSFHEKEREYIEDVTQLIASVFGEHRISESHHKKNHGTSVVVSSTKICRIFEQLFGTGSSKKHLPSWIMQAKKSKQKALILGWFRGDGNYYCKKLLYGKKEIFRISTTSETLAKQGQLVLARIGIASSLNKRPRRHENRQDMYTVGVGGEYLIPFGEIVGKTIEPTLNGKKRATFYFVDDNYLYTPIQNIETSEVTQFPVYNFGVKKDESYVAGGVAVHNCTAPAFSASSLHSAVVEIIVKKGARCQYTTIQNWYKTVYNLVTKRALVEEEGEMVWTDCNLGSKVTMKYPGFILKGKGARGETLSIALAGAGQHQDTGSKAIHLAPHTSSTILSKSISKKGGRATYRGLIHVGPHASNSKSKVVCDALLLDEQSRSDTYPTERVFTSDVKLEHEASVSKIGEEQLFYLMSRGLTEEEAGKMIVRGFAEPLVRKLPLEYAVEMNRLIDMEMEGSIG